MEEFKMVSVVSITYKLNMDIMNLAHILPVRLKFLPHLARCCSAYFLMTLDVRLLLFGPSFADDAPINSRVLLNLLWHYYLKANMSELKVFANNDRFERFNYSIMHDQYYYSRI